MPRCLLQLNCTRAGTADFGVPAFFFVLLQPGLTWKLLEDVAISTPHDELSEVVIDFLPLEESIDRGPNTLRLELLKMAKSMHRAGMARFAFARVEYAAKRPQGRVHKWCADIIR